MAEGQKIRRVFTATAKSTVDSQRRLTMPKVWRLPTDTMDTQFYLLPGQNHRIMVLTEEKMNAVFDHLDDISFANGDTIASMEDIASRTQRISLDKQGRFSLDPELAEYAGIKDVAIFKGALAYGTLTSPEYASENTTAPKSSSFEQFVRLDERGRNTTA